MLGNPENERKCIFYLDTKSEVRKEAANQIRHENVELIRKNDKLERSLPQNENQSRKNPSCFVERCSNTFWKWERSEHITNATKLAQTIYRSLLWE